MISLYTLFHFFIVSFFLEIYIHLFNIRTPAGRTEDLYIIITINLYIYLFIYNRLLASSQTSKLEGHFWLAVHSTNSMIYLVVATGTDRWIYINYKEIFFLPLFIYKSSVIIVLTLLRPLNHIVGNLL